MTGGTPRGDFVQQVRAAADISRLVSEHVPLKKAGTRLKGLCPFHQEKTPSFSVDPVNQLFFCFGCRTGGDVFKFAMLIEKVEFSDALLLLARKFGVPIPERNRRGGSEGTRILDANREATSFFRKVLASPAGAAARSYLETRGVTRETAEALAVGYAPAGWDGLKEHLRRAGFREEELLRAGLLVPRREGGGSYDRFRDRIMFPIEQVGGGIVGFGGRVLAGGEPKYLNSPETAVFNKGRHLYGLAWSREAVRDADTVIIVEGYLDFASLWQSGVRNVVAALGTGFTSDHARLLGRFSRRVVVNFDSDRAGREAAMRCVTVLLDQEFEVRVLTLPESEDPDLFVRREGAEAYRERVTSSPSFIDHLIDRAAEGKDLSRPEERARAVGAILPAVAMLRNAVLRAAAVSRIAERNDVPEAAFWAELRRGAPAVRAAAPRETTETGPDGDLFSSPFREQPRARMATPAERRLLHLLLLDAPVRDLLLPRLSEEDFAGLATEPIFAALIGQHRAGHEISVGALEGVLGDADGQRLIEIAMDEIPGLAAGDAESCWNALRRGRLERERHRLQRQLQKEAEAGDTAQIDALLRRKLELSRQIDALS